MKGTGSADSTLNFHLAAMAAPYRAEDSRRLQRIGECLSDRGAHESLKQVEPMTALQDQESPDPPPNIWTAQHPDFAPVPADESFPTFGSVRSSVRRPVEAFAADAVPLTH